MGRSLPQTLLVWGSVVYSPQTATKFFLTQLYGLEKPSEKPLSDIPNKADRNAEICGRYANGESVPDLAKAYGISKQRIYQVIKGKRK